MPGSAQSSFAPMLLISMPQLDDPNFARSVVLLCDYGPEGAFGLVHATTETGLAVIAAITSTRLAEAPGVGETASLAFAARDAVVLAND